MRLQRFFEEANRHAARFRQVRPFSAGIQVADTLYVSGQTGTDAKTGKVPDNFEDEVKQCLAIIPGLLQAGGMDFSDVVAVTVYMTDIDQVRAHERRLHPKLSWTRARLAPPSE